MTFRIPLFFGLTFFLLTGWGHWGPKVKVGLSLDHLRWPLADDLRKELEEEHAELLVSDAQDDPAAQENEVKDLIRQDIQALVVVPSDPAKASDLVALAHQAGLKVISLERLIPNSDLDYLIDFNYTKAGQLQAQALVQKVPKGRYVLLGRDPADKTSQDLRAGQMKALQPLIDRGDIRIADARWAAPSEAADAMKKILTQEAGKVDAVLASDNKTAEGVIQALNQAGLSGKVAVAGLGDDLAACRRIEARSQTMTVYPSPPRLAEEAAYLAAKLARKATEFDCQFVEEDNGSKKVPAVLVTPLTVDAGNLDSTIISDKVQTQEAVYGK